ncbi:MAG: gamma-glutamyltransferase, partial [Alphaproteobacteria bacterium]|nr:gamma-glutamyltransferase [Alphaproteobacteria bacterium]
MARRNHIFLSLPGRARGKPGTGGAGAIAAAMAALLALAACEGVKGPGARASADEAGFAPTSQRKPVIARRQMVASANPIASRVGLEILRKGGAAIDAAVAMQMVLTLVEPQSSGIGGSSFLMHFEASSGEIAAFEGRETAARAVKETLFMNPD